MDQAQAANVSGALFGAAAMPDAGPSAALLLSRGIYSAVRTSEDGIIRITPALAQRILDLLNFKRQRKIKPANVLMLKTVILGGQWDPDHPIFFARMDGLLTGTNLQHRMHAIIAADTAVRVRVIIAERSSEAAIAKLYSEFDGKRAVRGDVDVLVAHDLAGLTGLSQSMVQYAMGALTLLLNDLNPIGGGTLSIEKVSIGMIETRIAQFPHWLDEVHQWAEVMHLAPTHVKKKLRNASVMAVGLYTLRHQPESALAFWTGLAENDKLGRSDPRARLLADFASRKGASPRELVQSAAHAWNAWYEKRQIALIRCDSGVQLQVSGTPLGRKHH